MNRIESDHLPVDFTLRINNPRKRGKRIKSAVVERSKSVILKLDDNKRNDFEEKVNEVEENLIGAKDREEEKWEFMINSIKIVAKKTGHDTK